MPRGGPKPGRALAGLFPAQADEWHPSLNGDTTPFNVSPGNNSKVWWMCLRCSHAWEAVINNRTAKHSLNCLECNRRRKDRLGLISQESPDNSIARRSPDLTVHWHTDKNAPLTPACISVDSTENVWWLCDRCGHVWAVPPRYREGAKDRGCPDCRISLAPPVESRVDPLSSLDALMPQIASQWHPTRNEPRRASMFSVDSPEEAWWVCQNPTCQHTWLAAISTRTRGKRRGCPACQRPRSEIPALGSSFAVLHQSLAREWHPTLNSQLNPDAIKPQSSLKVWWKCSQCQHEWQSTVANRTTGGNGCKPCSYNRRIAIRDTPKPGFSLADLHPDLLDEWHPTLNDRRPETLKPGSDARAWWKCRRGHVWAAHVYARTGKDRTGCPTCWDLPEDGQSLQDLRPDLADQWHPEHNKNYVPLNFSTGSAFRAWWQCPIGHTWRTSIANRAKTGGSGCPQCRTWGTSQQQIRIAYELEAAGCPVVHNHDRIPVHGRTPVNADIVIPEYMVVVEFDGSHHHIGSTAEARDERQTRSLERSGWHVIRVRPTPLNALRPTDVLVADGRATKDITIKVLKRITELGFDPLHLADYCADGQLWAVAKSDADIQARFKINLATEYPGIAAEWHPTRNGDRRPELTGPGSREKTWWRCGTCSHDWATAPKKRTGDRSGCPKCARTQSAIAVRKPKPGRSLAELKPDLLRIFHPARNGTLSLYDLNFGTTAELWWLCPDCGNEWSTRTPRGTGCRPCAAIKRAEAKSMPLAGESLADQHPHIAIEWHPTKNDNVSPSDVRSDFSKPVWWQCRICGREWKRSPGVRVSLGSGCRQCSAIQAGAVRRRPSAGESLADTHPLLAREWITASNDRRLPTTVKANSIAKAWWRCSTCQHEWYARIDTRALRGHGCKKCASVEMSIRRRKPKPGRSLADVKPQFVDLWHPTLNGNIQPSDISPSSHTLVWWRCPNCRHEWESTPHNPACRPCGTTRGAKKRSARETP
jgi:Probable Zinc-ribbon domain/Protein of unknown function (DUF559)